MRINKLIIENFKGIKHRQELELKPITILCGPNSSGKSSCIHALAALAQTMKLSNSMVPIVLDDEFAQIHLGRFLDVIHSKTIDDSFKLGIGVDKIDYEMPPIHTKAKSRPSFEIETEFKAKGKAQEIFVQSTSIKYNNVNYLITKSNNGFSVKRGKKLLPFQMESVGKFAYRPKDMFEKGANPTKETLNAFFLGETIGRNVSDALNKVLYLGPFRQSPLRRYPTRGSQPSEVGASGEAAVAMLANEFSRSETDHPNITTISKWVEKMRLGQRVILAPVANTDLFDVSLSLDDGAKLPLPDLGYGVSQVLPILVQCSFAPNGATLLFEQPELHLHEGAAQRLGGVLVDVVNERGVNIIAETHSRHLINEILQRVKHQDLNPEDFVLYDVCRRNGQSEFRKVTIEILDNGDPWIDHPWNKGLEE